MRLADTLIQELEMEAATTRRVLERVPDGKMDWKPAEKSRSLGQLAMHIAMNPGSVAALAATNPATLPDFGAPDPSATSSAALVTELDRSLAQAKLVLAGLDDASLMEPWSVTAGGRTVFAAPRIGFLRSIMLNHWYHHRGQLSVYLRELGVAVPSIYGPSADENPFMPA